MDRIGNVTITTKAGRRVTDAGHGNVTHVLLSGSYKALCGTEPGRHSDWSAYPKVMPYQEAVKHANSLVTCYQCKKRLYKLAERPHW